MAKRITLNQLLDDKENNWKQIKAYREKWDY